MPSRLGRPPLISRDAVIAEALRVAARDGFAGLTIRAVAEGLGVVPMALYRHVPDKARLLEMTADAALAAVEPPPREAWDDALLALAELGRRLRQVLLRYPGAAAHVLAAGPLERNALAITEWSLHALRDAGYDIPGAARAASAFADYVIGRSRLESEAGPGERLRRVLETLDPASYPLLAASTPTLGHQDPDDQFEYGLARLIDGLRAELSSST